MKKNLQNILPKEELVKLYKIQGQSLGDIAKSYRVSRVAIMKYCNILGIERRTKGEARILAQKRGKIDKQRYCANISLDKRGSKTNKISQKEDSGIFSKYKK